MRHKGPPTVGYNGRRAYQEGSPPGWYWRDDDTEVPPEIAAELYLRHVRKEMARTGVEKAGPKERLTIGERRRPIYQKAVEDGATAEEAFKRVALAEGFPFGQDPDEDEKFRGRVQRSMAPDRTAPDRWYRRARQKRIRSGK